MSKFTVMIQARTSSKRFPRKVLAMIEKKPMIWHVIQRVKQIPMVEQIVLITSDKKEDKILQKIAKETGINFFTGSLSDVLGRHYKCAVKFEADPIIRITGDCPLIDPKIVEEMSRFYMDHDYDYVSNILNRTFPDGLDAEIFSFKVLKLMFEKAQLKSEREHVTLYIKNNIKKFKIFDFTSKKDLSRFRWTVDEKEDLKFVRKIYAEMRPRINFSSKDVMKIISKKPHLQEINKKFIKL